jgi:hypothetical protein
MGTNDTNDQAVNASDNKAGPLSSADKDRRNDGEASEGRVALRTAGQEASATVLGGL